MPVFYRPEPHIKLNCVIVDIDDTVARLTLDVKPPYMNPDVVGQKLRLVWNKYHADVKFYSPQFIEPIKPMIELIETYANKHFAEIIFLTGREGVQNGQIRFNTWTFIHENFERYNGLSLPYNDYLFMREPNDFRPNDVVKEEILTKYILPRYDVLMAFDDNEDNVKMFKKHNILTIQPHLNREVN